MKNQFDHYRKTGDVRSQKKKRILANVSEYAKSRSSFSIKTFISQQTYFTPSNPQFQERDLGGVKKKLLIFFLKLGFFSIFSSLVGLTGGAKYDIVKRPVTAEGGA